MGDRRCSVVRLDIVPVSTARKTECTGAKRAMLYLVLLAWLYVFVFER
jgi:hypothetical protein